MYLDERSKNGARLATLRDVSFEPIREPLHVSGSVASNDSRNPAAEVVDRSHSGLISIHGQTDRTSGEEWVTSSTFGERIRGASARAAPGRPNCRGGCAKIAARARTGGLKASRCGRGRTTGARVALGACSIKRFRRGAAPISTS
jgi:hypothetical protein